MRLRINLVKNFTRKILSKISRANQYQTRNSKIFEGKKMKEKKKKEKKHGSIPTRYRVPPKINHFYGLLSSRSR